MYRLDGWDYSKPYFYMVTIARHPECRVAFSRIREAPLPQSSTLKETDGRRFLEKTAATGIFLGVIQHFHEFWRCIEPIEVFSIMPDHIHLIVKIKPVEDRKSLVIIVRHLIKELERAYWSANNTCGAFAEGAPLFRAEWHDWIVKQRGGAVSQLNTFVRYIRENPFRSWLRRENAQYFAAVREVEFLGRCWYAKGNLDILKLPVLRAFKGHRTTKEGSTEWQNMLSAAGRIGPGGAGVSTFMSPLEKQVGNAIIKAGGRLVLLYPDGFGERWRPTRAQERLCAAGRMLFLSLYPPQAAKCSNAELYARCHEMVDLAAAHLAG